jgi:hypothetical protein
MIVVDITDTNQQRMEWHILRASTIAMLTTLFNVWLSGVVIVAIIPTTILTILVHFLPPYKVHFEP